MSTRLVDVVAADLGVTKTEASKIVKSVTGSIEKVTSENGSLSIINFGSFTVKPFKRTSKLHGKEYKIDKNIIRFKAGAGFSKAVN